MSYRAKAAVRVVFEGDSLTSIGASCGGGVLAASWPGRVLTNSSKLSVYTSSANVAFCGERTDEIQAEYVSQVQSFKPLTANDTSYIFLWAGVNDLHQGFATPAQTYANLKTYWATARADGFKVVASTLLPLFGNESEAITLNSLILSDPTLYDYIMRPEGFFQDYSNATDFYSDKIHLKPSASNTLGVYLAYVIDASPTYGGAKKNGPVLISGPVLTN